MWRFLRTRLEQGTHTALLADEPQSLPQRYRGRPVLDPERSQPDCPGCIFPDLGDCLFSPEELEECGHGALAYTRDYRMAVGSRAALAPPLGELELARALGEQMRRRFGRSLRLRSVAAGSCNGCEAELVALGNVVFDLARFGVQFVASPRHADGLVVTGAVSRNMLEPLYRTYEAIPEPKLVIAVGACALGGGPFQGSPEVTNGVPRDIPVDLCVPGCPPHPLTIADGILRLLGRLPGQVGLDPDSPLTIDN